MAFVLINTVTGTRRTILVPVKACLQRSAPAAILTHPHQQHGPAATAVKSQAKLTENLDAVAALRQQVSAS